MKKLYIPVALRRAAKEASENLAKKYQEQEKMKYKIVRNPGYRYELVENK